MDDSPPAAATLARIGVGASAEVFALPDRLALKLLWPGLPATLAARELAATRVAHGAGLPVPAPVGETTLGGRSGLILDRLHEPRLLRRLRRWPGAVMVTLAAMARRQAALHQVAVPAGTLPLAHDVITARIADSAAPKAVIEAALAALAVLPRGDRLGHGDLHLGNVMNCRRAADADRLGASDDRRSCRRCRPVGTGDAFWPLWSAAAPLAVAALRPARGGGLVSVVLSPCHRHRRRRDRRLAAAGRGRLVA